jgi:hypothetical protein
MINFYFLDACALLATFKQEGFAVVAEVTRYP